MAKKAYVRKNHSPEFGKILYVYDPSNPSTPEQLDQVGELTVVDGVPTNFYHMLANGKWSKPNCVDANSSSHQAFQWIDCDDTVTMDHVYNKKTQEFKLFD